MSHIKFFRQDGNLSEQNNIEIEKGHYQKRDSIKTNFDDFDNFELLTISKRMIFGHGIWKVQTKISKLLKS